MNVCASKFPVVSDNFSFDIVDLLHSITFVFVFVIQGYQTRQGVEAESRKLFGEDDREW